MYRNPDTITLANGRTVAQVLADHRRWLLGEAGGVRADLSDADLTDADLTDANLTDANLRGADLTDADLSDANLRAADLTAANLRDANLRAANLRAANLRAANLTAANLTAADLRAANLRAANLTAADLTAANLRAADLTDADLTDANLRAADLTDADLRAANLRAANLTAANLRAANLTDANLRAADLTAANLREVEADVRALARDYATAEVLGLVRALHLGRVDGTTYSSECGMGCLVGTIAHVKHVEVDQLPCNSNRPAEVWALAIRPGDCAPNHPVAGLTAKWLLAELVERPDFDKAHPWGDPGEGGKRDTAEQMEARALELLDRARAAHEEEVR